MMKIVLYKPNGNPKEYHGIISFVHLNAALFEFTHHMRDVTENYVSQGVDFEQETIRTNLP